MRATFFDLRAPNSTSCAPATSSAELVLPSSHSRRPPWSLVSVTHYAETTGAAPGETPRDLVGTTLTLAASGTKTLLDPEDLYTPCSWSSLFPLSYYLCVRDKPALLLGVPRTGTRRVSSSQYVWWWSYSYFVVSRRRRWWVVKLVLPGASRRTERGPMLEFPTQITDLIKYVSIRAGAPHYVGWRKESQGLFLHGFRSFLVTVSVLWDEREPREQGLSLCVCVGGGSRSQHCWGLLEELNGENITMSFKILNFMKYIWGRPVYHSTLEIVKTLDMDSNYAVYPNVNSVNALPVNKYPQNLYLECALQLRLVVVSWTHFFTPTSTRLFYEHHLMPRDTCCTFALF